MIRTFHRSQVRKAVYVSKADIFNELGHIEIVLENLLSEDLLPNPPPLVTGKLQELIKSVGWVRDQIEEGYDESI